MFVRISLLSRRIVICFASTTPLTLLTNSSSVQPTRSLLFTTPFDLLRLLWVSTVTGRPQNSVTPRRFSASKGVETCTRSPPLDMRLGDFGKPALYFLSSLLILKMLRLAREPELGFITKNGAKLPLASPRMPSTFSTSAVTLFLFLLWLGFGEGPFWGFGEGPFWGFESSMNNFRGFIPPRCVHSYNSLPTFITGVQNYHPELYSFWGNPSCCAIGLVTKPTARNKDREQKDVSVPVHPARLVLSPSLQFSSRGSRLRDTDQCHPSVLREVGAEWNAQWIHRISSSPNYGSHLTANKVPTLWVVPFCCDSNTLVSRLPIVLPGKG